MFLHIRKSQQTQISDADGQRSHVRQSMRQAGGSGEANFPGRDEIEYLREGGNIREKREDMESAGDGSFRTYSHNFDQDGDNDFDSSYGDEKVLYEDIGAEKRFLSGENEDNDDGSSSGFGADRREMDRDDQPLSDAPEFGASTGCTGQDRPMPSDDANSGGRNEASHRRGR